MSPRTAAMTWEIIFTFTVVVAVLLAFLSGRARPDVIALAAFGAVLVAGIIPLEQALAVFANPAPITIAAMFVLSAGLETTGCIDAAGRAFSRMAGRSELRVMLLLMVLAGALSAFANNTVVVVMFLPVVIALARSANLRSSRLLLPLSFAAILGGTCTLTGTSTNLIVDGSAQGLGVEPFTMFEVSKLGIVYALVGGVYLATVGRRLLPERDSLPEELQEPAHRRFLTQFSVEPDSPLVGQPVTATLLEEIPEARILEIRRRGVALQTPLDKLAIEAGDRLLITLHGKSIEELQELGGIRLAGRKVLDLRKLEDRPLVMMEGIVGSRSRFVGRKIRNLRLRQRYGVHVLAVHREATGLRENLADVKLSFGDTLLLEGPVSGINALQREAGFVALTEREPRPFRKSRRWAAVAVMAAFVGSAALGVLPIAALAILAAIAMILAGCLDTKRACEAIHWEILFLIFGMLALGKAMETSQAAQLLVEGVTSLFHGASPYVFLAVIYLLCSVLTELVTNNAVAALLAPLVVGIAESLGVDSRPFIVAVMFGCSASFATPVGYQTNTYVYGAGGYRFRDFLKIGVPLNLILWAVATVLIPVFWPFQP